MTAEERMELVQERDDVAARISAFDSALKELQALGQKTAQLRAHMHNELVVIQMTLQMEGEAETQADRTFTAQEVPT